MTAPFRHAILAALLMSVLAGDPAMAADAPELELVTVVGKLPQPLREAAAAVSVITAEEIEAAVAFDFRDALRGEPGVSFARDPNRFGTGSPTVRGLGGNRVLVETDGVPAAKTFAIGNFSNTGRQFADLDVVERIEVLRGPASSLYGSDAIAGVIAITTIDPSDLLGPDLDLALRARAGYAGDDDSAFGGFTPRRAPGPSNRCSPMPAAKEMNSSMPAERRPRIRAITAPIRCSPARSSGDSASRCG